MLQEKLRWTTNRENLVAEIRQCRDEGRDVAPLMSAALEILDMPDNEEKERLAADMIVSLERCPVRDDYRYVEPESYAEIRKSLTDCPAPLAKAQTDEIAPKLKGAWTGRACGCLLGIPVEGWPRQKIHDYLRESGQYPLKKYISSDVASDIREKYAVSDLDPENSYDRVYKCWINNMKELPIDDDLNYTMLSLRVLERCGKNFTSEDVAEAWLFGLPALHTCTAERVAYRNLLHSILPPASGIYANPYREWIGAQIRVDFYGYINPGDPQTAAYMAYKDACVAQTKNGLYAAMLVAAMVAISAVCEDYRFIITEALKQIPPRSRLHEAVSDMVRNYDSGMSYIDMLDTIHEKYDEHDSFDWCLAIPNVLVIVCALLNYGDDYSSAICEAVLAGFDTDCNAATVGSIIGYAKGIRAVDPKWTNPVRQIYHSSVHHYESFEIEELVRRTICVIKSDR